MTESVATESQEHDKSPIPLGSLVSVTSMRLRDPSLKPQFRGQVIKVMEQLRGSGATAQRLYLDEQDPTAYYTVTVWPDAATMQEFRDSGSHSVAMELAPILSEVTSSVNWVTETNVDRLPTLEEVQQHLETADLNSH